mmetsp:Transcript_15796/g.64520  ORF Transcript_15796/g.64520 Transcript_15796/m.64520 type:complete len:1031 (-) Transcript_15796:2810-5902(-)
MVRLDKKARYEPNEAVEYEVSGPALEMSRAEVVDPREEREALIFMQTDSSSYDAEGNVRLFGVTDEGVSVFCLVEGFKPYFFVHIPPTWGDCGKLRVALQNVLQKTAPRFSGGSANLVLEVQEVERRSILYYVPGDPAHKFMKITLAEPRLMREAGAIFERGAIEGLAPTTTFEVTVDYTLRFMCDSGLVGCSWVEIPAGKYSVNRFNKTTSSQVEVSAHYRSLMAHKPEGNWLLSAPIRRLSFDIECSGRKGIFPEPEHDSVIQIANYVTTYGRKEHVAKVIFTLKSCAPISGVTIMSFDSEADLLSEWSNFFRQCDAEVITGYNIVNFDLPYLMNRAEVLGVKAFPFLGKILNSKTTMRSSQLSSSAFGTHESKDFSMDGRVIMDMLQIITRDYKLRSYSLNSVSAEFLNEQKEDVHYSIITDLQLCSDQTRRRLAKYCLKDAMLPSRLMDKLLSLTNYIEMARVTGIPLSWLISRGHMIKVVSLLHRKAYEIDLLIPDLERGAAGGKSGGDGPQFEGATVIEPDRGYYTDPIATLDFASLYPSIIMANNLCYSTLIRKDDLARLKKEDYITSPTGDHFVRSSVKKGVLSTILEGLLGARKVAKKDLAKEQDPFRKAVLDGRQLALKVSANAVYGFTGATVGKLPCMEISSSVTGYGRDMIQATKEGVESKFPGSRVIYGDTDSVMVKFGDGLTLERSMELGREAANQISQLFPNPIRLEFEKCYFPYLLISKKRYAGLYWTKLDKHDKMDCKGVESVRRDNCRLVANVISDVLESLLIRRDKEGAIKLVKDVISDLLQNKIDLSLLVVSKALTRAEGSYDAKQAHVTLAEKMKIRDPGNAPALGDRVPYVITRGTKKQAAYDRAEDPLYALKHNLPLDTQYYLENMLRKPLERIFEPILKSRTSELFSGGHTQKVSVVTPTNGIAMFAKKQLTCLGCRTPLKPGTVGALCAHCKPREAEFYLKYLHECETLEEDFAALWTECQRCMGEVCQDVYCSNVDCPIFYRRTKTQLDLAEASKKLLRFVPEW